VIVGVKPYRRRVGGRVGALRTDQGPWGWRTREGDPPATANIGRAQSAPLLQQRIDLKGNKQNPNYRLGYRDHCRTPEPDPMADPKPNPITIDELEAIAKQKLPSNVYDYYSSGSDDQKCLKRNRDAFDRYSLSFSQVERKHKIHN
jgi:hypothetical protein